jgi:hypothetical protein
MRAHTSVMRAGWLVAGLALGSAACGIVGPSCTDETGVILNVTGQVPGGGRATYTVVSPKNSNLRMRLSWPDTTATLGMRATITACGVHVGCTMDTLVPSFGPGGPSPTPQPWPPGLREMEVDGSQGKTWLVEITTDSERDVSFTLQVTYEIRCER